MEDMTFEIENVLGQKVTLTVISTIEDEENQKYYMIYTDGTFDEDNMPNLFVSEVINEGDGFSLQEIEDYEEMDLITKEMDKLLAEYQDA